MLDRAAERIGRSSPGIRVRDAGRCPRAVAGRRKFDIVPAAAVLHHLRDDPNGGTVFRAFHRPSAGGSI
jgi:tRNA (cmo5U34)-methyltransferase